METIGKFKVCKPYAPSFVNPTRRAGGPRRIPFRVHMGLGFRVLGFRYNSACYLHTKCPDPPRLEFRACVGFRAYILSAQTFQVNPKP